MANMSFDEYTKTEATEIQNKVLLKIKKTINNLELSAIRLKNRDENIGMVSCAAVLSVKEKNLDITYSAQITNEGDLYVEVFGL